MEFSFWDERYAPTNRKSAGRARTLCKCAVEGNPLRRCRFTLLPQSLRPIVILLVTEVDGGLNLGFLDQLTNRSLLSKVHAGTLDTRTAVGHGNSKPSFKRRVAPS